MIDVYFGYPMHVGHTDLGWSSPAYPFLVSPVPLSRTRGFAATSSSSGGPIAIFFYLFFVISITFLFL